MDKSQTAAPTTGAETAPTSSQDENPKLDNQEVVLDSNIENPTEDPVNQDSEKDDFDDISEGQMVPYERFKKVNDARKANADKASEYDKLVPYAQVGYALLNELNSNPEFKEDYQKALDKKKAGKTLTQKDKDVLNDAKDIQNADPSIQKDAANPDSATSLDKKYITQEEFEQKLAEARQKERDKEALDKFEAAQDVEVEGFFEEVPEAKPSTDPVVREKQRKFSERLFVVAEYIHEESGGNPNTPIPRSAFKKAYAQLTGKSEEEAKREGKLEGIETVLHHQRSVTPEGNLSAGGSGGSGKYVITDEIRSIADRSGKTPERIAELVAKGRIKTKK